MATTHLLSGSTPVVIRQTPLPWRLPNYSTAPPRFNLKFRPFMSTAHSANPYFKHSLRCSAKPPLNPISQPEDLGRLVGGFIGTILKSVKELTPPDGDPNLLSVDDFVDTVLDAVEGLKTLPSKRKQQSDTRRRDSDPVCLVDKEAMSPQPDPNPDPVKDIEDAILNAVEEMKKLPSIEVDDVMDVIRKAVEERKTPPLQPKPNADTHSKCSGRDRVGDSTAEAAKELKNLPSSPQPDPERKNPPSDRPKPKAETHSKCWDPDRVGGSTAESAKEPKNPSSSPKANPEVEAFKGELVELRNQILVWVEGAMKTVMEAVEELKAKSDTRSGRSNAVLVDDIQSAVEELMDAGSYTKSDWVDDIFDIIMKCLKDSQPKDLFQNPGFERNIMKNIIGNSSKDQAEFVLAVMACLVISDQLSNWVASGGRRSSCSSKTTGSLGSWESIVAYLCVLVAADIIAFESAGVSIFSGKNKTTVVKLQVGLSGSANSLKRYLNKIAQTANASTPEGLSYILTESAVSLLRHSDYYISASSSVNVETAVEKGEKLLNKFSVEERGKFDEETLVNVNNLRRKRRTGLKPEGKLSNEYTVMTILVAAEGEHELPTINGVKDMKEALKKLASIPCSQIAAVEVMWNPQEENDALSENELVEDYPHLKPVSGLI